MNSILFLIISYLNYKIIKNGKLHFENVKKLKIIIFFKVSSVYVYIQTFLNYSVQYYLKF